MKHVFISLFVFVLLSFNSYSQSIVTYEDISSVITSDTAEYDGLYSVVISNSVWVGTTYAITFYDDVHNEFFLIIPTNDIVPNYLAYVYKVNKKNVHYYDDAFKIKNSKLEYAVYKLEEYTYIALKCKMFGKNMYYDCIIEKYDFE